MAIIHQKSQLYWDKVSKSGDTLTNTLTVMKVVGWSESDWQNAQFLSRSNNTENPESRAGYGFENNGINAALLFLETEGRELKVRFNTGELKTIAFKEDI